MPDLTLDLTDAVELAEMLQFLRDWLVADQARLEEFPDPVRRRPRL